MVNKVNFGFLLVFLYHLISLDHASVHSSALNQADSAHILSPGAVYVDNSVCLSPGPLHHMAGGGASVSLIVMEVS